MRIEVDLSARTRVNLSVGPPVLQWEVRLQPRNGVQVVIGDFPITIPPSSTLTAWDDAILWSDSATWVEPAIGALAAWDDTILWSDSATWVEPAIGGASWIDSGTWIDGSNWTE